MKGKTWTPLMACWPLLVLCIVLSGCATSEAPTRQMNPMTGETAHTSDRCGKTYECLKVFSEVLTQVQKHYIQEVDLQPLIYSAIKGMLKPLGPQNSFLEPAASTMK